MFITVIISTAHRKPPRRHHMTCLSDEIDYITYRQESALALKRQPQS